MIKNEINKLLLLFVILLFLFLAGVTYSLHVTTIELNLLKANTSLSIGSKTKTG